MKFIYGVGVPSDPQTQPLPLFPLSTVFVPGMVLPLRIFEPRYRQLIADLQARPEAERSFGIIAIKDGWEVGSEAVKSLYPIGTRAQLRKVTDLPDGEYDITVLGGPRFELLDVDSSTHSYLTADITDLPDPCGEVSDELIETALTLLIDYRDATQDWLGGNDAHPEVPTDPVDLSYTITSTVLLEVRERQMLLACADADSRLRLGVKFMRREITLAEQLPSVPVPQMLHLEQSEN